MTLHLLVGLALVVLALVGLDWVGVWAERRRWVTWRGKPSGGTGSAVFFALADEIFQPSRTIAVREQESKEMQRQQVASPDPLLPGGAKDARFAGRITLPKGPSED